MIPIPYACNLIFTRSVGFAIEIAIVPEIIAVAIFYINVGY